MVEFTSMEQPYDSHDNVVGEVTAVSHYRIIQKVRSGGMGDVYLAEDEVLPRVVALKLLRSDRLASNMLHHRFMREARAASTLTHPNIARVYEAGEDGGRVYIAMEYVEGEPLDEHIARHALPVDGILRIALQLAGAMCDAHEHGVVHRDLKPSNVMITRAGDVKVLDFGLAKFVDPDSAGAEATAWQTESGLVLGTVPYMSPEQALGRPADKRSDIFSLGVILYELVTRRLPFAGTTAADTLFRIVNSQPEPMARFNYDLPVELERIVRKCLEKDPSRRYQSVAELLVDLRNHERDGSVAAHPHLLAGRMGIGASRIRTAIWTTMMLLGAIAGIAVWQRTSPRAAVRSLAVLPFEARGQVTPALSEGLADQVINDVAQLPGMRVMARSTSFRYRGAESPVAAGKALHVDAILTGTIEPSDNGLLVSTELVDVRDGSRLAGSRFDRRRDEIVGLATTIGDEVARALKIDPPLRAASSTTRMNPEAYRLYLRGRQEWNSRTPEGLRAALDLFRQTIEIEPRFAPAYAGLADTYSLLERYARVPNTESRTRAIAAAEHALQLDPSLPEAHASLASVRAAYAWDWTGAEEEYRVAIRLSPSYATAHHWHALLLARMGRFDEALEAINIARALDPLSPSIAAAVANIHYYRRDFVQCVAETRAALKLNPKFLQARLLLALALSMANDAPAALRELQALEEKTAPAAAAEAVIRARAGDVSAGRIFLRLAESRPDAAADGYAIAMVRVAMGDRAGAIRWLRAAEKVRSSWLGFVAVDPIFEPLHGDREFQQLVADIGLSVHGS